MNGSRRALFLAAGLVASLSANAVARAEEPRRAEGSRAQALFDEAIALMEKEHFEEACPKLEESERLDPGGGTALDLAYCFEHLGRTGRAFDAYVAARALAEHDGKSERLHLAEQHLAELAPRVARVRLHGSNAAFEGASVLVDGQSILIDETRAFHVERSAHKLTLKWERRAPWSSSFDAANGADLDVAVPDLESVAPPPHEAISPRRSAETVTPPAEGASSARRTIAIGVGGGGLAALGAGLVLGGFAFGRQAESNRDCPAEKCTARGVTAEKEASGFAIGSDIGVGLGVVALSAATYLWLTAGKKKTAPTQSTALVTF